MDGKQVQDCGHEGFHSGEGRYSKDTEELRYVLVCDDCGEEVREISSEHYVPNPLAGPV